ncbi:MAG: single-stranded DNA-binding protein [Oscillospiraceae bacterium]|nr:single-stranded DNA-binding protein [Oscillospiraceae bacterium]
MNIEGVMKTDVELRLTSTGVSVARFTLGINRGGKEDFINCTAWRNAAEFVTKYFNKGDRVVVTGITDGLRVGNVRKVGRAE